jgi:HK97 family phage portal protein
MRILELYADTYRIRSAERIDPTRVTIKTNAMGTEIDYYCVDSIPVPYDGVGSLAVFYGVDEGILNRAGRTIKAGAELETLGFDPEKLQLNQARSYVATELARATGIPAYYVDAESGSSMTYSNAQLARQSLLDFSLRPIMTAIEERLSMTGLANDFVPASQEVKFDLDDYLRGSAKERADVYKILYDIGALTSDEIRLEEEMIR